IPVGLGADETKPNRTIAGELIVAVQPGRAVVGRDQQIQISVAVEVCECETATDFGLAEITADRSSEVAKSPVSLIHEQMRRLGISDVAPDVSDSLLDVTIRDDEIEPAVEVQIGKCAAESERVA